MSQSPAATVLAASNLVLECSVDGDVDRLRLDHRGLRLLSDVLAEAAKDMRLAAEAAGTTQWPAWPAYSAVREFALHVLSPPT